MLCSQCEQRLSNWERHFAERCFTPITGKQVNSLQYGPWMLKFAASVSWRVLRAFKAIDALNDFPPEILGSIDEALDVWRQFLLDKRPHPGQHQQHFLVVDAIASSTVPRMPTNINRYLLRAIDVHVAYNSKMALTYAKMGPCALFGLIAAAHPR
jgi:hypothetical protein